jgi:hypothetical protein
MPASSLGPPNHTHTHTHTTHTYTHTHTHTHACIHSRMLTCPYLQVHRRARVQDGRSHRNEVRSCSVNAWPCEQHAFPLHAVVHVLTPLLARKCSCSREHAHIFASTSTHLHTQTHTETHTVTHSHTHTHIQSTHVAHANNQTNPPHLPLAGASSFAPVAGEPRMPGPPKPPAPCLRGEKLVCHDRPTKEPAAHAALRTLLRGAAPHPAPPPPSPPPPGGVRR